MEYRQHLLMYTVLSVLQNSQILSIQYTQIGVSDLTDCALILPNPAQYVTELLQSDFGGPINCITYEAINQAFSDARRRIDIPVVEDDWKPEEVAAVGQLLLDVSQQLTNQFNLNIEDIEIGLPQIDTLKTSIVDICPAYLSSISCRAGKYRRHDGLCNNVDHPTWGATNTPFTRLLPPQFADHISAPRISITGKNLPPARVVSRTIHTDEGYHDHAGTMMTVAWGQFMDHDFTLMGTPLDTRNRNEPEDCCNRPDHIKNPYCMEITIPEDDYFYKKFNVKCQDFVRAFPGVQPNCKLGSRTPFNTLTAVIDGNTVYGATENLARQLRVGSGGLLKMNPAFTSLGLKDLLPMKVDIPDEGCTRTNSSQFCFQAGEIRVNEQLVLACIHTLMAREHNRIATELAKINPHWDDEILYQEARRITVAEIQHITFNEFLPLILGKTVMEKYGILLSTEGYWDGYNPEVNPNIMDAFSAAAYRFGHSLLPSSIERWSKLHKFIASKRLSEVIRRPYDLYRAGVIDEYFLGLLNQVAQAMDDSITQEVTNNLFKKAGNRFGLDLVSFNIQRGRDFGLPGYMYYRKHCGLSTADSFIEMSDMMPNSTILRYISIFEHPWDIDLWSGGVAENPLPGSMVGPTFACIIATQMSLLRRGDRFWYELPNQPSSFTPEQLQEIRKIKLSRILCDNSDLLDTVQIYSMVLPDHDINPRVPCRSSILAKLDLNRWADTPVSLFDDSTSYTVNTTSKIPLIHNSSSAPLYAYHVKTIAIIEGSSSPININDLLSPNSNDNPSVPYKEDPDYYDHRVVKRNANFTDEETTLLPVDANKKEIEKRHLYQPRFRKPRLGMTQAIMKEEHNKLHSRSAYEDSDNENFFPRHTSTYGSIPSSRGNGYRSQSFSRYNRPYTVQKDEEDEEEKEQPMSVEEVDPEHDTQYEEVPMMVDEHGNQKVMPVVHGEDDISYRPKSYSFPKHLNEHFSKYERDYSSKFQNGYIPRYNDEYSSRYPSEHRNGFPNEHFSRFPGHYTASHSSDYTASGGFSGDYNSKRPSDHRDLPDLPAFDISHRKPTDHPYKFHHPAFRTPNSDAFSNPSKYGTSHQYNSLADDHPRYYKHFIPPVRSQSTLATADELPYTNRDYSHESVPQRFRNYNFPFSTTGSQLRPQEENSVHRSPHVPQTLEEYHRLHNTFKKNPWAKARFNSHKVIPKEERDEDEKEEKEDEDDKEEKDEEFPENSRPFVSMNFKNFGSNDDGISIKYKLDPPKSSFHSHRHHFSETDNSPDDSVFPYVVPSDSSAETPQFQDPKLIKSFVNSMFRNEKAPSNIPQEFSRSNSMKQSSPFNPNFGERLKPAQNILWHREAATSREKPKHFRNMYNKEKAVHEDDVKPFDSLRKSDFNFGPSKRDLDVQNDNSVQHKVSVNGTMQTPSKEEVEKNESSAVVTSINEDNNDKEESQEQSESNNQGLGS